MSKMMSRKRKHRDIVKYEILCKTIRKTWKNPNPLIKMFHDTYLSSIKRDTLNILNVKRAMLVGLEDIKEMYENRII